MVTLHTMLALSALRTTATIVAVRTPVTIFAVGREHRFRTTRP